MLNVLAVDRLTLISLVDEGLPPPLAALLQFPGICRTRHINVRAQTIAHRTMMAAQIDAAIAEAERAVLLVAQGTGCMAAAWWSRLSPSAYVSRVAGAVMVAPDATGCRGTAFASPRCILPFSTIVVGTNDESQRLAAEWGSRLIDGPLVGNVGPSRRFLSMMERFTAAIVERDVRAAGRLLEAIGDR
jgi:hypothetical protein